MSSKILALIEDLGNLVRLSLLPSQRHDSVGLAPWIDAIAGLIADKALDSDTMIADLTDRGAKVVLSLKGNRKAR